MKAIHYTKAIAVGNDFIVVEMAELSNNGLDLASIPELARQICNRETGVGADGLEVVHKSRIADAEIHLWNSDGSTAELSGNGTRCVAAYLRSLNPSLDKIAIDTAAGLMKLKLTSVNDVDYVFRMAMQISPSLEASQVEMKVDGQKYIGNLVDVGNPQCGVFVKDLGFDWISLGEKIERDPLFPKGTNVSFIEVLDRHTIAARFWERGAGATKSSGTGSVGAAAVGMITNRLDSPVTVKTEAGEMLIEWLDELFLEGAARIIKRGIFEI